MSGDASDDCGALAPWYAVSSYRREKGSGGDHACTRAPEGDRGALIITCTFFFFFFLGGGGGLLIIYVVEYTPKPCSTYSGPYIWVWFL